MKTTTQSQQHLLVNIIASLYYLLIVPTVDIVFNNVFLLFYNGVVKLLKCWRGEIPK